MKLITDNGKIQETLRGHHHGEPTDLRLTWRNVYIDKIELVKVIKESISKQYRLSCTTTPRDNGEFMTFIAHISHNNIVDKLLQTIDEEMDPYRRKNLRDALIVEYDIEIDYDQELATKTCSMLIVDKAIDMLLSQNMYGDSPYMEGGKMNFTVDKDSIVKVYQFTNSCRKQTSAKVYLNDGKYLVINPENLRMAKFNIYRTNEVVITSNTGHGEPFVGILYPHNYVYMAARDRAACRLGNEDNAWLDEIMKECPFTMGGDFLHTATSMDYVVEDLAIKELIKDNNFKFGENLNANLYK